MQTVRSSKHKNSFFWRIILYYINIRKYNQFQIEQSKLDVNLQKIK